MIELTILTKMNCLIHECKISYSFHKQAVQAIHAAAADKSDGIFALPFHWGSR